MVAGIALLDWKPGVHPWCSGDLSMFGSFLDACDVLDACEYYANDEQYHV